MSRTIDEWRKCLPYNHSRRRQFEVLSPLCGDNEVTGAGSEHLEQVHLDMVKCVVHSELIMECVPAPRDRHACFAQRAAVGG